MAHVTVHVKFSADFDTDCEAVDEESALDCIADKELLKNELLAECYENMSIIAGSYDEEEPEYDEEEPEYDEEEDETDEQNKENL